MSPAGAGHSRPPRLLLAGLLVAAGWGAAPPWVGPRLGLHIPGVPTPVEVVDHAVPAVVLAPVAVVGLTGRLPLTVALVGVLAALWMTATHLPLLAHAHAGLVDVDAAVFHSVPGLVLLALTLATAVWAWRNDAHRDPQPEGTRRPARHPDR